METSNYSSTESKTSSEDDLVDEQINPEILEILGIDDVFDLDQGDYMSLLREAMVKANTEKLDLTQEQLSLLANERKRIRDKKDVKFTTKKINKDKFFNKDSNQENDKNKILDPKRILPPSGGIKLNDVDEEEDNTESELESLKNFLKVDLFNSIKDIGSIVKNIESLLENRNSLLKKESESERKQFSKSKFREKEDELEEKKESKIGGILSKITKPFTSLFDTIKNFLMNVLIGSLLNWLLSVLEDPRKLLQPIQNLLDGIFDFFNNIVNWMDNTFVNPIRYLIDTVNNGISGFIDILNNALSLIPGASPIEAPKIPNIPEPPKLKAPDLVGRNKNQQSLPSIPIQTKNKGGIVKKIENNKKNVTNQNIQNVTKNFNEYNAYDSISDKGGRVNQNTGLKIEGLGPDTQLTALKKDEFVLVPGAAKALGIPFLESVNKKYGGNNAPSFASLNDIKIRTAAGGGRIVTSVPFINRNIPGVSSGMHMGADVEANYEPLKAYVGGEVFDTSPPSPSKGYGPKFLAWKGTDGYGHMFAHMSQVYVKKGDKLRKGQKVGVSGKAGTGPHLHWEVASNPTDVGADKSSRRTRLNPITLFGKEAPFGGDIMPGEGNQDISPSESPGSTETQSTFDPSLAFNIIGDPSNPRNKGFLPLTDFQSPPSAPVLPSASTPASASANPPGAPVLPSASTPASSSANPPGALAPGQRPDRALTSQQFKVSQQARAKGIGLGMTGQALEKYVANAVMGTTSIIEPAAQTLGVVNAIQKKEAQFSSSGSSRKLITPPSSREVKVIPLPPVATNKSMVNSLSGASSGGQGSSVPGFSSVNGAELGHLGAVRSIFQVMDN